MKQHQGKLRPGQELYSVATGRFNPLIRASRVAVDYLASMDGLSGVHVVDDGRMLWLFDTLNHAKIARNLADAKGIQCGTNIGRFVVAADGAIEADGEWARSNGIRKGL